MSYHILHITTSNCILSSDRGLLFCEYKSGEKNSIAIADIRAIIIASHGVTITNSCIAKLMENNIVILHCNNSYKPVGWSVPLERIVRPQVFYKQIEQNPDFEKQLWKNILIAKVTNQAKNLDAMGAAEHNLYKLINKPLVNEANIAKQYWQKYFTTLGNPIKREHFNAETFENGCLNYGYAVISSLIYRSIIVHGLIAGLGIHHKGKYKSTPLVYDLMEPYRAFIDYYFYCFVKENEEKYKAAEYKEWFKYLANCIKNYRIKIDNISYKFIDTIDIYIERIIDAYLKFDCTNIFLPDIKEQYLHIDKHRNREYEE